MRRRGLIPKLRLSVVLVALALVPLLGLTVMAGLEVSGTLNAHSRFQEVEIATNELLVLVELEAAVVDESYWTEAARMGTEMGIPTAFVTSVLSLDLESERDKARARTDRALADVGPTGLTEAIQIARATEVTGSVVQSPMTAVIETDIRAEVQEKTTEVITLAAELDRGASLVFSAEVLQRTNAQRSTFSDLVGAALFLLIFGDHDQNPVFLDLAGARASYEDRSDELAQLIATDPGLSDVWSTLADDQSSVQLLEAVDDLLLAGPPSQQPVQLDALSVDRLNATVEVFQMSLAATQVHSDVVDAAGIDLRNDLDGLQASTQRQAQLILGGVFVVALMSAAAVVVATQSIVRPLRDLSRSATALRSGDTSVEVRPRGPSEIRAVAQTLNDAKANLHRAEDQALALADGRLDDVSLTEPVAGSLGQSLHDAVHRLRMSLAQGESYRDQLAYEAEHDGLTKLPNRKASIQHLEQELERTSATDAEVAVLFIDLDGFKSVNDLQGHPAGDTVLATVAQRLAAASRSGDLVGRLGGDEFLVVAPVHGGREEAMSIAHRLRDAVRDNHTPSVHPATSTDASIGVVVGGAGHTAEQLVRDADLALYDAKDAGRGRIRFCDAVLRGRADDEIELTRAIRRGLDRGEFELHGQPLIDVESGGPNTVEALLRWTRPGQGAVSPEEIVAHAERSDLILEIDRWVLAQGISMLASWRHDPDLSSARIALNVSGRHLLTGDLVGAVRSECRASGVDPSRLTIEITEGAMLVDLDRAAESLTQLRKMGIQIAIDDFGTGYTSLAHLRSLPADVLKVDRSFTRDLQRSENLSLVKMIIETGHILGLRVTIEGVETKEQQDLLERLGADSLQGYYYSRPAPFSELGSRFRALAAQLG